MDDISYDVRVVAVVKETADAHSVSFAVPETSDWTFKAGQFLTLAVPSEQTGVAARCYSISSSPYEIGPLTVTVKRTANGYASNWICDQLTVGSTLRSLPPAGVFTPASLDSDLLLFAGGSGITPIMSITRAALTHGSGMVVLFYANRDEESTIFLSTLSRLSAEHQSRLSVRHWLESHEGLPTREQVRAFAQPFTSYDAFVCGPEPFMELTMSVLKELDFPRERRHQERFISLGSNPFGDGKAAPGELEDLSGTEQHHGLSRIEVDFEGHTYEYDDWNPTRTLLEHLEDKGLKVPYSCRQGECSTCAVRLLEGEVRMLKNDVLDDLDLEDRIRLACQSLPTTDVVRVRYN